MAGRSKVSQALSEDIEDIEEVEEQQVDTTSTTFDINKYKWFRSLVT